MKAIPLFRPQNMSRVSEVTQCWGGGAKGILCRVIKLKNHIVNKGRSME